MNEAQKENLRFLAHQQGPQAHMVAEAAIQIAELISVTKMLAESVQVLSARVVALEKKQEEPHG